MKTPDINDKLHRFIDGAMAEAESAAFASEMEKHPELADEVENLTAVSGLIKAHVTMERPLPNADFFNSQVQEHIAADQRAADRTRRRYDAGSSWFNWLLKPWVLAGATALVALGVFLFQELTSAPKTEVIGLYTPDPSVIATPYYSKDAAASVLMLDGLDAFPSDHEISVTTGRHDDDGPEIAAL